MPEFFETQTTAGALLFPDRVQLVRASDLGQTLEGDPVMCMSEDGEFVPVDTCENPMLFANGQPSFNGVTRSGQLSIWWLSSLTSTTWPTSPKGRTFLEKIGGAGRVLRQDPHDSLSRPWNEPLLRLFVYDDGPSYAAGFGGSVQFRHFWSWQQHVQRSKLQLRRNVSRREAKT